MFVLGRSLSNAYTFGASSVEGVHYWVYYEHHTHDYDFTLGFHERIPY